MMNIFKVGSTPTDQQVDSKEEMYFVWYLEELVATGFVKDFRRCPTYQLGIPIQKQYIKPMKKVEDKILEQTIMKPHEYTPDYIIMWERESVGVLCTDIDDIFDKHVSKFICQKDGDEYYSHVEIKGGYDRFGRTDKMQISIKWLFQKMGIFTNLIKMPMLFEQTFTPKRYHFTDKKKEPRKIKWETKSILQYVDEV